MTDVSPITRVAVVIVNYRAADMVLAGLPSLAVELASFERGIAVVVDNASPGDDADRIARFLDGFPDRDMVRVVRSPVNGGFSAGNNLGFDTIATLEWQPEAVMLLNPDAMLRTGALRALTDAMAALPAAAVVGARLEEEDGTPSGSAFRFPCMMGEFSRMLGIGMIQRHWPVLAETSAEPTRADWVTGAAMLIRTRALHDVGRMDEGYFLYYEEVDLMRAFTRRGWEVWHCPQARVVHVAGSSTGVVGGMAKAGRMPEYWFRSWLRYFAKNHGIAYARATAVMRFAGLVMGRAIAALRGRRRPLPQGYIADFLRFCVLAPAPRLTDPDQAPQ